ncbi:uncharacterized protein LOC131634226 [Vicia villosa]|uniref:uncharacterized protein LOC131634226 n=1 Tax=Vicia villosa TaxID=3911 RepID=UPI00273B2CFD|nr:uncharacterized protein LOC131634226 [Vicia villosa]
MVNMSQSMANSFWFDQDVDFSASASIGLSGGLLILWKKHEVEVICSFRGVGFLGIKVVWKNHVYYIINVYSYCAGEDKRILWNRLLELKAMFNDGDWVVGGDFNAVKNRGERVGRSFSANSAEWSYVSAFIDDMNLVDVPCKKKKFSWFSGDGRSKSRLHCFLVSDSVINRWGVVGQRIDDRDVSDHCPVWLMADQKDWGPKPFKFNNEWFRDKEFHIFVEKEWKDLNVSGRGDFVLKEKMRLLKPRLRWWNSNVFRRIDLDIENDVNVINRVDEVEGPDENDLDSRNRSTSSKYFHRVMKQRLRRNHIDGMIINRDMEESVDNVKRGVVQHFAKRFVEEVPVRSVLEGVVFKSLSIEDRIWVELRFTEVEVKEAIWNCDGSKSPGPDGYSILFIKWCWSFIKEDIMSCFGDFHTGAVLSKSITSSFLALIPKKNNPMDLDDFRPICLVGCIHKILSKVLAGRLKKIVGGVISNS